MAPKKLWQPVKELVSHEWATMKEAWLRVHAALFENIELTPGDLKAHLLAKRLVGAARVKAPDGSERCIIFEPAFWEPVELPFAWSVTGWKKHASEGERWYFFVRRRELDKRYPRAEAATPSLPVTPPAEPSPSADQRQQRRRPGPKPTDDWPIELAAAVIRKALHDPKALENVDALVETMQTEFDKAKLFLPRDPKPVRALLLRLLKHIR
jgi:hypothetical protein